MLETSMETGQTIHLDLYRHKNPIVNDAYDRLVAGIHLQKRNNGYSSFTITGCEPGAGATTIAISLAVSMALSGWKTLLIDTDMKKSSSYKRLNQEIKLGLSHYFAGEASLESIICDTNHANLHYIASGELNANAVELLCSQSFDVFLSRVKERYDIAIFDTPSLNAAVDAGILSSKTDAVILVARHDKTKVTQVRAAKRELDNVGANLLGIILNHVSKPEYKRFLKNYDYFKRKKFLRK